LDNNEVDFINCQGVLHHTSHPERILSEFKRILRPEGHECVMVYNRDSLWFHLYTAYEKMVLQGEYKGLSIEEAFSRNIDGSGCPMARCWVHEEFEAISRSVGFSCEYHGGYLSYPELFSFRSYYDKAIADTRLSSEHRIFLQSLVLNKKGLPLYKGFLAGMGGVYTLKHS
jgi:SAM-dependent methyltransferase